MCLSSLAQPHLFNFARLMSEIVIYHDHHYDYIHLANLYHPKKTEKRQPYTATHHQICVLELNIDWKIVNNYSTCPTGYMSQIIKLIYLPNRH